MEITWHGHSCFSLKEDEMATVVMDPYDHTVAGYLPLHLDADIITISQPSPERSFVPAVTGTPFVIEGPGEYELGNVFITGVHSWRKTSQDNGGRNTLYVFDYNGLTLVHLGSLNKVPEQAEVQALGPVHIALVPVGGGAGLNASKAAEVISLFDPNIIIPMHYEMPGSKLNLALLGKFMKEMGLTEIETAPLLKVSSVKTLPEETEVVVLELQQDS
jgi:L-ascorbate metabolism protein UlaG (beta-lactamase superfamily)